MLDVKHNELRIGRREALSRVSAMCPPSRSMVTRVDSFPGPSAVGRSASLEHLLNGRHGDEQLVGMIPQSPEFVMEIEGSRILIQCVDHHANGRHLRRVFPASVESVHQKKSSEALSTARAADSQPAQAGCRQKRVAGKLLGYGLRKLAEPDAVCRQRVVAHQSPLRVNKHEWCSDLSSGILPGLLVEVSVEFRNARMKAGTVLIRAECFYPIPRTKPVGHRRAVFSR